MKVINLSEHNSVLNMYLREIRDVEIQKDPLRFRRNASGAGGCLDGGTVRPGRR